MDNQSLLIGKIFFDSYCNNCKDGIVLDIGSKDYNGSLKEVCPKNLKYIGIDLEEGKGVDVILKDPYKLPFEDNSVDFVVSASAFYCVPFFWVLFLEVIRVLKKDGLFYLNVPSYSCDYCPYPIDCWRFFPDAGKSLAAWGQHNNYNVSLVESFITQKTKLTTLNFFIGVFGKDIDVDYFSKINKMMNQIDFKNGNILLKDEVQNRMLAIEDNIIINQYREYQKSIFYKLFKISKNILRILKKSKKFIN